MKYGIDSIDKEIVNFEYVHTSNQAEYYLYYDTRKHVRRGFVSKDPENEINYFRKKSACFREVLGIVYDKKKHGPGVNRICVIVRNHDERANPNLTFGERKAWIKLAIKNKLLPEYISTKSIKKDPIGQEKVSVKVVLDISDISIAQLYIYLSTLRYIREDPGFVKSVVYLVNETGLDFYAAFVFASASTITYEGHHIIYNATRAYGNRDNDFRKVKFHLAHAIGIHDFVNNVSKYDSRKVQNVDRNSSWCCASTINNIINCQKIKSIESIYLYDDLIPVIIREKSNRERCIQELKNKMEIN
jgi:hypothetical protein